MVTVLSTSFCSNPNAPGGSSSPSLRESGFSIKPLAPELTLASSLWTINAVCLLFVFIAIYSSSALLIIKSGMPSLLAVWKARLSLQIPSFNLHVG
uniref:MSH1 n=1 Tax=Arundo donax TaxID=35708 RepID=A0A0A8YX92_ARUDO